MPLDAAHTYAFAVTAIVPLAEMQRYAADLRSIILGAQHPPYEAHIGALSLVYKF